MNAAYTEKGIYDALKCGYVWGAPGGLPGRARTKGLCPYGSDPGFIPGHGH